MLEDELTCHLLVSPSFLFMAVFELLVKVGDRIDALSSLLIALKLKTHVDFFAIVALEGELVAALGLVIEGLNHSILILKHSLVILAPHRNAKVKCDDLGGRLARRDLDQIVHKESTLDHGIGMRTV